MAERSFTKEVEKLRAGNGEVFYGEGILAVTKALLQSGVAYVGGYQGAPISHLMDVLSDAQGILGELGVHFEASASEASAAAMLAASVNYPLRGAVTWKSTVGTNVAADALANVSSGGVIGGALIIVGEDYGEGSSIMQERSHAFAMKSQIWLLDPRPSLPAIVNAVEQGFELSEASNTPVMLELRIRACHVHGQFTASDNRRPEMSLRAALENPVRDTNRIVLPPANFAHEQEKIDARWPAALKWLKANPMNEFFGPGSGESGGEAASGIGIIVQGGLYNTLIRAMQLRGLCDSFGNVQLPLYVLNVTYPLIEDEVAEFCAGKQRVLLIEEGQPNYIEQAINAILRRRDIQASVVGKDLLPMAGEYTGAVVKGALEKFIAAQERGTNLASAPVPATAPADIAALNNIVPPRPAGFCTGCPERPIFTAMTMVQDQLGPFHVSCDIGCHLFSILPPFNIGNTTMGYGLGAAGASAFATKTSRRAIAVMGDGGFWHNGLTSGVGNAVFNNSDNVLVIVDNEYAAATGGQDILSSRARNPTRSTRHAIVDAVRGVGVKWVRKVDSYDIEDMKETLTEALTTRDAGPKVIVVHGECQLNRQRRVGPLFRKAKAAGKRVLRQRFGVDAETCTGDHACIRLSGCPSLTLRDNPDPLRDDPVAYVDNSCVGCGVCGSVAHAAVLCPSFYRADIISSPNIADRLAERLRGAIIGRLQAGAARRRARRSL